MSVPIKKFSAGGIQVAIWENESTKGEKFNSVSIQRNYKDKKDEWKSSSSLRVNDIPKATVALQKAYEWLVLKEKQPEKEMITAVQ